MMYSPTSAQTCLVVFACLVTWPVSSLPAESTLVRVQRWTNYGPIQGYNHKLKSGGEVERYLGVPYAAPPIRDLRFEHPKPPTPWTEMLQTTTLPPACMQENMDKSYILEHKPDYDGSMDEDCLYLNIYVPAARKPENDTRKMEVMVSIHGGSNVVGMGAMFHGDVIADIGQIIVVTFNYRLGVFGFLYVPDFGINGNYGLHDQTMALTWVKENIAHFGGDPNKVTIQGHSAGGIDVGLHVLSPKSKGLFRAAILQSGSPVAYWALIPRSKAGDKGKGPLHHLHNLGCYVRKDRDTVLKCLRKIDAVTFIKREYHHETGYYSFLPVVDGDFIPEDPTAMLQRLQKGEKSSINCDSVIVGITNDEGSLTAEVMIKNALLKAGRPVNYDSHNTLPPDNLNIWDEAPPLQMFPYNSIHAFHELTVYLYTPWRDKNNATANVIGISNMVGDSSYLAPAVKMASLMSSLKDTNVYLYNFNYRSSASTFPAWMGVPHGVDLFYTFGSPVTGHTGRNYTQVDRTFCVALIKMWVQFVKQKKLVHPDHLTPLPHFKAPEENYVDISSDTNGIFLSVGRNIRKEYTYFWNHLIPVLVTGPTVPVTSQGKFIQWILLALLSLSVLICVVLAILLRRATKKHFKRRPSSEETGNMLH